MSLCQNLEIISKQLPAGVTLCAVSKFQPAEAIEQLYEGGQRVFGESRPQELADKAARLPHDIEWHFIGHLQTNKVGLVVPVATLIQSVDSERLLVAIAAQGQRIGRTVDLLLQVHIAQEQTKQGFSAEQVVDIMQNPLPQGVRVKGLMGMASNSDDLELVRREFSILRGLYQRFEGFDTLSMGMSGDYGVAVECGSSLVRVGTAIFGSR